MQIETTFANFRWMGIMGCTFAANTAWVCVC